MWRSALKQFRFAIQSPERKKTRSGRSAASSETTAARVLRSRRVSLSLWSTAHQLGRFVTTGSAFAGMMSSPARGGKRRKLNNLDGQLRGDWRLFNALVDLMRKEAWGSLVVRPRPLGKQFLKVLTAILFRFLVPERIMSAQNVLLPSFLPGPSIFLGWTKITHLNMPEKHGHTHFPPS